MNSTERIIAEPCNNEEGGGGESKLSCQHKINTLLNARDQYWDIFGTIQMIIERAERAEI